MESGIGAWALWSVQGRVGFWIADKMRVARSLEVNAWGLDPARGISHTL